MAERNKHGLARDIDAAVKRQVRQRDGCVRCGSAIYTYEHVDPEFADAKIHDPECIALLCSGCHGLVTKRLLSKESVKQAMSNPKCQESGFAFGPFDIGSAPPKIRIGAVTAQNVPVVIQAMGDEVLRVEPPEEIGGPFRISARLANESGSEVLRIDRNEWKTPAENWDVQVIGPRITIHNGPGDIALVLVANPPAGITVERLNMFHKGAHLTVQIGQNFVARSPGGAQLTTTGTTVENSDVAIRVSAGAIELGAGGGTTYIKSMSWGSNHGPGLPAPAYVPQPSRRIPDLGLKKSEPSERTGPKTGRNQPCSCGSGLKYKRCHGA